ncbi:MAG: amidohydrolase family protein [Pseudomonadales bacterium]
MFKSFFYVIFSLALVGLASNVRADTDEEATAKPSWDVNAPPVTGGSTTVDLDTDQGTWMSVDISPDGKQIAFDLLGNIYLLPVNGGEAELLVGDHSWDIQPRFSPDGQSIAFTSDRSGGDNIWTINLSDRSLQQISYEDFRLPNNPTWSPDGEYIAVRKHFTTSRSLGTGEIWLYHKSGRDKAKGVQVIKRPGPNYQKELGEPAFSPDGQYLYYTQNATPGDMFVYHQDTNKEIFHIKRYELATGKTTKVVGGPGGAVRPTPSPDGSQLAFIKRVQQQSKLLVHDLRSGRNRVVAHELDPDSQETWAVNGVYPNIAWLPDGSGLVFWTGGKIWRVALADGALTEIPFRVRDTRTVLDAPRVRVEVAPDQFATRMVRFASRSPTDDSVVFASLGKLWLKRGDRAPVRLTRAEEGVEYAPVWSPDGNDIYYLHWQDQSYASIRVVSARGGRARVLSSEPGHYERLAMVPDGSALLVHKLGGSTLTGLDWGKAPGIYHFDLRAKTLRQITDRGANPHLGADGRLYVNERKRSTTGRGSDDARTQLLSMTLSGDDVRVEAESDHARLITLSPDGTRLLFQQGFQVHVVLRPLTGQALQLGPKLQTVPAQRVSEIGGLYPHWSADSRTVSWSVGPDYVSVDVQDALAGDAVVRQRTSLSMQVDSARPDATVAVTNARIITMDAERSVIERGTLLIEANRIVAVGDAAEVQVPAEAQVFDAAGKTIIPGLIDAHAHGPYGRGSVIPEQNYSVLAHLALGVTTVHNPSSSASQAFAAAEYQRAGLILAPRIFSTAEIVYGAKGVSYADIQSLQDALNHIRRLKAQGATSIKNYNQPRREQRQQVIEAARQEGLLTVAEGGSLFHLDMSLIADGTSGIEHNVPALNLYDDVVQFWRASQAGYTPTLVVVYGGLTSEDYFYAHTNVWEHPLLSNFVPPQVLEPRSIRRITAPERDFRDDDAARAAKILLEAGVLVNTGAHGQREGLATHWEMWSFARGGMSPMQVLSLATINPAQYLGMAADLGSLEPGKLADLVILDANPLKDIRQTDKVSHVMLNGRLYRAADLSEVVTGDARLQPLWWQRSGH